MRFLSETFVFKFVRRSTCGRVLNVSLAHVTDIPVTLTGPRTVCSGFLQSILGVPIVNVFNEI